MQPATRKLTYANVMSTLALFVALGGVSWAVATLPKNSVGAAQLRKNAVTERKVADGAVTEPKLSGAVRGKLNRPLPTFSIDGVAAGGTLSGTYPNPSIAKDTLTGDQIDEGTLHRPSFAATLAANASTVPFDVPGIGRLTVECIDGANNGQVALVAVWLNSSGAIQQTLNIAQTEGGTTTTAGVPLSVGSALNATTAPSATANLGRKIELAVRNDNLRFEIYGLTDLSGAGGCGVWGTVER